MIVSYTYSTANFLSSNRKYEICLNSYKGLALNSSIDNIKGCLLVDHIFCLFYIIKQSNLSHTYLDSSSLFISFISVGIIFVAFKCGRYGFGNCPRNSERMNFNSHLKHIQKNICALKLNMKVNEGFYSNIVINIIR